MMKIYKLFYIIFIIIVSCQSIKKEETQLNNNIEKDTISDQNAKIYDQQSSLEKEAKSVKKNISDADLVNMAVKLQIEAGGEPISMEDTLKLQKALTYLDQALKINEDNDAAYTNKVLILCILERYREAIKTLQIEIDKKENFAEGLSYQGFIYEKLNMMDSAQLKYKKAIEAYSNRVDFMNKVNDQINRAFLLFFVKGEKYALEEIDYIIKNNPDNDYARNMKYAFENFNRDEFIEENLK